MLRYDVEGCRILLVQLYPCIRTVATVDLLVHSIGSYMFEMQEKLRPNSAFNTQQEATPHLR